MQRWRGLLTLAFLSIAVDPGRAQSANHASASPDFRFQHGTLVVVIMESNQIVIAVDSRATANRVGQTNSVQDGTEKVTPLSPHVVFFFTGAGLFGTRDTTNALADMAQAVAAQWKKEQRRIQLESLAQDFKARVAQDLSRFNAADIHYLHVATMKTGSSNVFRAFIAGQDADAAFRMFRVTCNTIVETNGDNWDARMSFDVAEEKRGGRQWIVFLGAAKIFGEGMSDPAAPLAPFMKQLKTSNALLAEPAAAGLLAAGLREYGDGPDSPVGFPIFVYSLDADGVRLTRKVEKGQRITFDPRDQGK